VNVDSAGNITFKPTANHVGAVSFAYTVSDGTGAQSSATVSGSIQAVNDTPVAVDDTTALNGNEDTTSAVLNTTLLSNDKDAEDDRLTITMIGGTELKLGTARSINVTNGTVNVDSAGNITFKPTANHVGAVSFAYTVSDGTGAQSSATVSGSIQAVNDTPVAGDDTTALNGNQNTTSDVLNTTLLKNDTDADGDTLTITMIGGTELKLGTAQTITVTNGTVNVDSAGNITFTPTANHVGAVSFAYTVSDGKGGTNSATVSGSIQAVNNTPVAQDDTTALDGNQNTTSDVLNTTLLKNDTDADGDTLKITMIGGTPLSGSPSGQTINVTNGTVNVDSAGSITFTPADNYAGGVSFAYTVSDGNGGTNSATVSGTINEKAASYFSGYGIDTLIDMSVGATISLTGVTKLLNFEKINTLDGEGADMLNLDLAGLSSMIGDNSLDRILSLNPGTEKLVITGDTGDFVKLAGAKLNDITGGITGGGAFTSDFFESDYLGDEQMYISITDGSSLDLYVHANLADDNPMG
jgi:hypothetical protein